jgi:hypothetical protein
LDAVILGAVESRAEFIRLTAAATLDAVGRFS